MLGTDAGDGDAVGGPLPTAGDYAEWEAGDVDAVGRPLPAAGDKAAWTALRTRHHEELGRRSKWCQQKKLFPLQDNLWQAPGDDLQFMLGVRPWLPGSNEPNPAGVPWGVEDRICSRSIDSSGWQKKKEVGEKGWNCHQCKKWVDVPPRAFEGTEEPYYWWWCVQCRKTAKKPTKKDRDHKRAVKGMAPMHVFFKDA